MHLFQLKLFHLKYIMWREIIFIVGIILVFYVLMRDKKKSKCDNSDEISVDDIRSIEYGDSFRSPYGDKYTISLTDEEISKIASENFTNGIANEMEKMDYTKGYEKNNLEGNMVNLEKAVDDILSNNRRKKVKVNTNNARKSMHHKTLEYRDF